MSRRKKFRNVTKDKPNSNRLPIDDISKYENLEYDGVKIALSPAEIEIWNRASKEMKSKHARLIKELINKGKIMIRYETYIDKNGFEAEKYKYIKP